MIFLLKELCKFYFYFWKCLLEAFMKSKKYNWKLHNKTVKHPYTGSKAIDKTCRCHGGCDWCRDNRQYQSNKKLQEMKQKLDEFLEEKDEG